MKSVGDTVFKLEILSEKLENILTRGKASKLSEILLIKYWF